MTREKRSHVVTVIGTGFLHKTETKYAGHTFTHLPTCTPVTWLSFTALGHMVVNLREG